MKYSQRYGFLTFVVLHFVAHQSGGLTIDGLFLLSLKYSTHLNDPFGVMKGWNRHDATPCWWNGVSCSAEYRVTGLSLPGSGLEGTIPASVGRIQHLRFLNLSNNSINGSIPSSFFNANSKLEFLDLSKNSISGDLPELVGNLKNLQVLDLSDNALVGNMPQNLIALPHLTSLCLKRNNLFGSLVGGFDSVIRVFDVSSNLINGTLPPEFGGGDLAYLNISFNRISGAIPFKFVSKIPANAIIDVSFNNLSGPIPEFYVLFNQNRTSFAGNPELCGEPLKILCSDTDIPSSIATYPSSRESPLAIAVIPKLIYSNPSAAAASPAESNSQKGTNRLKITTILGIVIGNIVGIVIVGVIFLYVYRLKKKKTVSNINVTDAANTKDDNFDWASSDSTSSVEADQNMRCLNKWTCLKKFEEETSSDEKSVTEMSKVAELVTLDGERELDMESLLKASAYILGASGSSIMYKAVLEDGTALAVRQIGENGVERFRDFENQVRVMAKLVHPNLVRIRGFYWGSEEKLIIYEFVPNGSLANVMRKAGDGSSQAGHLGWETRVKIAKGVASGLAYIHEKKHVHGNLKPTNILFGADMEAKIGVFGLERLGSTNEYSSRTGGGRSARNFDSKRSMESASFHLESGTPSPSPSAIGTVSPYHAPESLRSLKPTYKWDVFSYGVVLLELLTGKVVNNVDDDHQFIISDEEKAGKVQVLKYADAGIRGELVGKKDSLLALLKLGYNCVSPIPQKRPSMKEVLHTLHNYFPSSSS